MLALPHVVYAVNKMDLVEFSEERFDEIVRELAELASQLELHDAHVIPHLGAQGRQRRRPDATRCRGTQGPTLLDHLETVELDGGPQRRRPPLPGAVGDPADGRRAPRLPRLRRAGRRRDVARRRRSRRAALRASHRVAAVDSADGPSQEALPGESVTILLEDDVDVSRGDLLADPERPPVVARELLGARLLDGGARRSQTARALAGQAHHAHGCLRASRRSSRSSTSARSTTPRRPAAWSSTTSASCASGSPSRSPSIRTCATARPVRSSSSTRRRTTRSAPAWWSRRLQ